jgi:hypothetical protein
MTRLRPTLRAAVLGATVLLPTVLPAQAGERTVAAGPRYEAGALRRMLAGRSYRELWTAPATVPVLDLSTYAGGLTPFATGGGNQTRSLRFHGADGREYGFRSVDKSQTKTLHPDLQHTLTSAAVQDQVSSLWPAAGVVAHRVEAAAGVPHTDEQLFVMPDDPRLGEFRQEFAGMLGTVEERPAAGHTTAEGLAGASRIEETDSFFVHLQAGPGERFDDRGYLAVRLVDILLGDWDRHGGQYLWARLPAPGGGHLWRVLPRDRDYAFVDYDGLALSVVRGFVKNAVRFRDRIDLMGMLVNAAPLDHRLLGGVDRAAWDSVTRSVQARLGDAEIDAAIAALPAEYRARDGAMLAARLRARRDDLPRASAAWYALVTREPEAHGTDLDDVAEIERLPSGNVRVVITSAGTPVFARELVWTESREVRVYLHGGADRARVFGSGPEQVIVRVIGGAGDDALADEGRPGRHTAFYDSDGTNSYVRRSHTKVDEHEWTMPMWEPGNGSTPPRDWGFSASALSPGGGWMGGGVGPYVSVGPSWRRYGFRREPYAVKQSVAFQWAPQHTRFGVEYRGDFRYVGRVLDRTELLARATELDADRFYGFGNDTDDLGQPGSHFRVWERQLLGDAAWWHGLAPRTWIVGGVTGRYTDSEPEAGTPAADEDPPGAGDFAAVGGRVGLVVERGDSVEYARRGWRLQAWGTGFPYANHDASAFGGTRAVGTAYLSAGGRGPTLALRAGGEKVWGGFPFQYAAYLGGSRSLRGYASERFAGDASAFGNAELRQVITRANLLLARGNLGAFGLADAGRVWFEGDSPGGWHTAFGGGLFFSFLDGRRAVSAAYAQGETGRIHLTLGMPF